MNSAEWHIKRRYEESLRTGKDSETPKAKAARFLEAVQELKDGRTEPKPWEVAMGARRRDVLRELANNVARLRHEGDTELADQVDRFMQDMPPLDSERRQIQRALVEQVRKRLQEHTQDKGQDPQRQI